MSKGLGNRASVNAATPKGHKARPSGRKRVKAGTNDLRQELLRQRYLLKDAQGRPVETPGKMFARVANAVSMAEAKYGASPTAVAAMAGKFLELMLRGQFLPNSPALMNAGRKGGALGACFVLPIGDSIDEIFDSVKHTAQIQRAGGGTGFAFDRLRPTGDRVASSGGQTSGPISFLGVFAKTTEAIQQGAFRRGANMAMLSVNHPDILRFVTAKNQPGAFENFNFSVKATSIFMEQLHRRPGAPHVVVNPRDSRQYLIPKTVNVSTYGIQDLVPLGPPKRPCYSVADVWDLIIRSAYTRGEPGLCFIDRVNRDNPTPALGSIEATNPCGEQPLLDYEACTLGSINLAKFVLADRGELDWDRLGEAVGLAVRFLDDAIDASHYPIPQIRQITLGNRKIGLGVMGFADVLVSLSVRYNSDKAVELAEKIGGFLTERAHRASRELAESRGSFPNWAGSVWDTRSHRPMRNAACTTIAPTGSISLLADCSSGIEPIFRVVAKRRVLGKEFLHVHPLVEQLGSRQGWMNRRVRAALLAGRPPLEIHGFPRGLAELLVTAHEVSPEWHVRVQAAFQKHIDNAVSKTVNLPATATVADVDKIFRGAWERGCKGITVYREDSQPGQTISSARAKHSATPMSGGIAPRPRPPATQGRTFKFRMGCGTLFVTVNRDGHGPCEVFANLGKAGGCPSQSEATCRAVSAALRSGVNPRVLVEQLKGIRCLSTWTARQTKVGVEVLSCPDAIARALDAFLGGRPRDSIAPTSAPGRTCPFCHLPLRREAGCFMCEYCGWNGCGEQSWR